MLEKMIERLTDLKQRMNTDSMYGYAGEINMIITHLRENNAAILAEQKYYCKECGGRFVTQPGMIEKLCTCNAQAGNAGYKEPAEDTLLTECCKALGWQGGTIHQIKQILIKAKKVKQAYETMQMPQSDNDDVEKFKAAMAELIYVFHKY
jgi:uncharacterized protein with PIN domain